MALNTAKPRYNKVGCNKLLDIFFFTRLLHNEVIL